LLNEAVLPRGDRLRLLQATPGYAPAYELGGPTQSLEGLDDHLARLGVDIRVLTTNSAGHGHLGVPAGWTTWRGIPVRYVRRWARPDVAPAYLPIAFVEARRAHVVHINAVFSVPSVQAIAATSAAGRPWVLSTRGALEPAALGFGPVRKKRAWLRMWGPFIRRATLFHATSVKEADSIREAMGNSAEVRIVPNGVDLPPLRTRWDAGAIPMVAFIGRLHRVKALENLIDAVDLLRRRGHRLSLEIAGPAPDDEYRHELIERIAARGLQSVARLVGEVRGADKQRFYERSRVCVLPSSTENFGNVVIEALGHGVPVVASRFTPWEELEEAQCGRWTGNSPRELADAIEPYVLSADLSRDHGLHGRALVERRYTWTAVARSMLSVYREAVERALPRVG